MIFLLDVDGCMYDAFKKDGSFTPIQAQFREADEDWAVKVTGKLVEELREYRKKRAPEVGMDRALLEFMSLHSGREYWIPELKEHRCGPDGYHPEKFLKKYEPLVSCLKAVKEKGHTLVIVTDNPVTPRTVRAAGVNEKLIPDEMIFGPERMGGFKDNEFLRAVMRELKVRPDDVMMFGDSIRSDIIPAHEAGIKRAILAVGPDALIEAIQKAIIDDNGAIEDLK